MQPYTPFYSPFAPELMLSLLPFLLIVALWTVIIKGYALWHAARASQKKWFVVLLVVNTLGILEIIYLVWFRPTPSHTPAHHSSSQA